MSEAAAPPPDDDEIITIGEEHLDRRVDLEAGMSPIPVVSLVLASTAILVFVLQLLHGGDAEQAEHWVAIGAKDLASIRNGEVWRLVSPVFLHGGPDHIIGNVLVLYVLGVACEHAFGRTRTLSLFVATAICGSLVSCLDDRPSVGASGAVFGLLGALATAVIVRRDDLHVRDKRVGVVLFVYAAWSLVTGVLSPVIDNWCHLGGFASGCALGALLRVRIIAAHAPLCANPRHAGPEGPALVGAALSAAALLWALVSVLPRLLPA